MKNGANGNGKAKAAKPRKSRKKKPPNPNGHNQWNNDRPPIENLQATIQRLPDLQPYLDGLENDWSNCPPGVVYLVDQLIQEIAYWQGKSGVREKQYRRVIKPEVWRPIFLRTYRNTGNIRAACERAGISRETANKHMTHDPVFAAECSRAEADAVEYLEAAAWNRSIRGVVRSKALVSNGKIIGYEPIVNYPDGLHARLLEARHPKYRRRLEVSNGEQRERAELVVRDYMLEQDCDRALAIAHLSQSIPELPALLEA